MPAVVLEDESLRDGLQFESKILSLEEKRSIFRLLVQAGVKRIQVGSFVHPKVVPQMADTDVLIRSLRGEAQGVLVSRLGAERQGARAGGGKRAATREPFFFRFRRAQPAECEAAGGGSLFRFARVGPARVGSGMQVRAGIQCAFGCVYEGAVPEDRVVEMAVRLAECGANEINLADTTGMANPFQVRRLVVRTRAEVSPLPLSIHLHDTRGLGLANMLAAYESGVTLFDVAAGGLGGCPFVKGASGNVAAEDAVNLFEQIGVATGIDLRALCRVVDRYEELLGRTLPGRMNRVIKSQEIACE